MRACENMDFNCVVHFKLGILSFKSGMLNNYLIEVCILPLLPTIILPYVFIYFSVEHGVYGS